MNAEALAALQERLRHLEKERDAPGLSDRSPRELAELLWLRAHWRSDVVSVAVDTPIEPREPSSPSSEPVKPTPRSERDAGDAVEAGIGQQEEEAAEDGAGDGEASGLRHEVGIDRSRALRNRLEFARELNRIARRGPSTHRRELDVAETVRRTAAAGLKIDLAFRRPLSPHTHLVVIVDRAGQMVPWRRDVVELTRLVPEVGSFASFDCIDADFHDASSVAFWTLPDRHGHSESVQLDRVLRPGREHFVLVISDGVGDSTHSGAFGRALKIFPEGTRVAWVHPWGEERWHRTGVQQLRRSKPRLLPDDPEHERVEDLHIPVVPFTPEGLHQLEHWAQGRGPGDLVARRLPTWKPEKDDGDLQSERPAVNWSRSVERFASAAHPLSMELLSLASCVPGRVDLERLFALGELCSNRQNLGPVHVAEAMSSGFLRRYRPPRTSMHRVVLEFVNPDVKAIIRTYSVSSRISDVLKLLVERFADGDALEDLEVPVSVILRIKEGKGLDGLEDQRDLVGYAELISILRDAAWQFDERTLRGGAGRRVSATSLEEATTAGSPPLRAIVTGKVAKHDFVHAMFEVVSSQDPKQYTLADGTVILVADAVADELDFDVHLVVVSAASPYESPVLRIPEHGKPVAAMVVKGRAGGADIPVEWFASPPRDQDPTERLRFYDWLESVVPEKAAAVRAMRAAIRKRALESLLSRSGMSYSTWISDNHPENLAIEAPWALVKAVSSVCGVIRDVLDRHSLRAVPDNATVAFKMDLAAYLARMTGQTQRWAKGGPGSPGDAIHEFVIDLRERVEDFAPVGFVYRIGPHIDQDSARLASAMAWICDLRDALPGEQAHYWAREILFAIGTLEKLTYSHREFAVEAFDQLAHARNLLWTAPVKTYSQNYAALELLTQSLLTIVAAGIEVDPELGRSVRWTAALPVAEHDRADDALQRYFETKRFVPFTDDSEHGPFDAAMASLVDPIETVEEVLLDELRVWFFDHVVVEIPASLELDYQLLLYRPDSGVVMAEASAEGILGFDEVHGYYIGEAQWLHDRLVSAGHEPYRLLSYRGLKELTPKRYAWSLARLPDASDEAVWPPPAAAVPVAEESKRSLVESFCSQLHAATFGVTVPAWLHCTLCGSPRADILSMAIEDAPAVLRVVEGDSHEAQFSLNDGKRALTLDHWSTSDRESICMYRLCRDCGDRHVLDFYGDAKQIAEFANERGEVDFEPGEEQFLEELVGRADFRPQKRASAELAAIMDRPIGELVSMGMSTLDTELLFTLPDELVQLVDAAERPQSREAWVDFFSQGTGGGRILMHSLYDNHALDESDEDEVWIEIIQAELVGYGRWVTDSKGRPIMVGGNGSYLIRLVPIGENSLYAHLRAASRVDAFSNGLYEARWISADGWFETEHVNDRDSCWAFLDMAMREYGGTGITEKTAQIRAREGSDRVNDSLRLGKLQLRMAGRAALPAEASEVLDDPEFFFGEDPQLSFDEPSAIRAARPALAIRAASGEALIHLQRAAKWGNIDAMEVLGLAQVTWAQNIDDGLTWLQLAADEAHAVATAALAQLYWAGWGEVAPDRARSIRLLDNLRLQEVEYAEMLLARRALYLDDGSDEVATGQLLALLESSASDAHPQALAELGMRILDGDGLEVDEDRGLSWLVPAAELWDPATWLLGLRNAAGYGVEENLQSALNWLQDPDNPAELLPGAERIANVYLQRKEGPAPGLGWIEHFFPSAFDVPHPPRTLDKVKAGRLRLLFIRLLSEAHEAGNPWALNVLVEFGLTSLLGGVDRRLSERLEVGGEYKGSDLARRLGVEPSRLLRGVLDLEEMDCIAFLDSDRSGGRSSLAPRDLFIAIDRDSKARDSVIAIPEGREISAFYRTRAHYYTYDGVYDLVEWNDGDPGLVHLSRPRRELRFTEGPDEVRDSLSAWARFMSVLPWSRSMSVSTTYWVYDPIRHKFAPNKFVGFGDISLGEYRWARDGKHAGATFTGGAARKAVEKALGRSYAPDPRLDFLFREWMTAEFGEDVLWGTSKVRQFAAVEVADVDIRPLYERCLAETQHWPALVDVARRLRNKFVGEPTPTVKWGDFQRLQVILMAVGAHAGDDFPGGGLPAAKWVGDQTDLEQAQLVELIGDQCVAIQEPTPQEFADWSTLAIEHLQDPYVAQLMEKVGRAAWVHNKDAMAFSWLVRAAEKWLELGLGEEASEAIATAYGITEDRGGEGLEELEALWPHIEDELPGESPWSAVAFPRAAALSKSRLDEAVALYRELAAGSDVSTEAGLEAIRLTAKERRLDSDMQLLLNVRLGQTDRARRSRARWMVELAAAIRDHQEERAAEIVEDLKKLPGSKFESLAKEAQEKGIDPARHISDNFSLLTTE